MYTKLGGCHNARKVNMVVLDLEFDHNNINIARLLQKKAPTLVNV